MSTVEKKLGRLARRSRGVVARRELLEAGVTRKEIDLRLRRGYLIAVFRGVYRVGHTAPSTEAGYTAAVMACGNGALLSGQAAGYLLELLKGAPPPPEVTAPTPKRISGLRTRRGRRQGTTWRGIPVTTVAETIVDLAAVLTPDELARAFHQAGIRHHTTPAQVEAVLARRPYAPGAGTLRRVTPRRRPRHPQHTRETLPGPARPARPTPARDQPARRQPPRRLPLAPPPADRRARQLPLPPLPPRLGERPAPRTRSPRPRRPPPPLHLQRRTREPGPHAHRARPPAQAPAVTSSSSSVRTGPW